MHQNDKNTPQQSKEFKNSIKRLINELKSFHILIIISLILAFLGSILSIIAPNKLSQMTDEISLGLNVNQNNLKILSDKVFKNINENNIEETINNILQININENTITKINNSDISDKDKQKTIKILKEINNSKKQNDSLKLLSNLPNSTLKIILTKSTFKDVKVTTEDKIKLIQSISKNNIEFPKEVKKVLFNEITIDNIKISSYEQTIFFENFVSLNKSSTIDDVYKKIDKMPSSIQKILKPSININKIKFIALFLCTIYLLSALFNYIQTIIMATVSNKFAYQLRNKISIKINKLPLKYFDNHQSGDVLSRVTNDVDTVAQSMNQSLSSLVSSITLFIGTIIMMFITNWIMAITAILSSLIGFLFMVLILSKSQKYFIARQTHLGNLNGHIEEIYSNLNVVKVYNGQQDANDKFDEYNKKVYEANSKSQFLSGLMMPIMHFVGNFGYVAVCIVGALLTMNNIISFGVIVAFIAYVRLFTSPLSQIAQSFTSLQSTAAASERVFEFIDENEMISQKNIKTTLEKNKVKGYIEFNNVCFKYKKDDKYIINNFNAKILPGQKIAIVGPTGAGKTTIVNLIMKFYDINSGDIKIDGISIKSLTRENVRSLFTMVLQDTWLFDGTIKENLVYNRNNINDTNIKKVCETIGVSHFIKTLPNSYESYISNNDSISAGQKQLLTIARAMLNETPFLILDEATSNVDTRTEELVQKAMDKLSEKKTSFIIAHRLSTIKNADLILVMKDGNIIEQGTHDELINNKNFYYELYNSQFEL